MQKGMLVIVAGWAGCLTSTLHAYAGEPKAVPLIKGGMAGDGALTCPEILAEHRFRNQELDIIQDAMDKIEVEPSAKTQAISAAMQAVAVLAGALPMPVARLMAGGAMAAQMDSAADDFKAAYAPLDKQFDFALDRMDLMSRMYQRKCLRKAGE